jgi:hypothetical protein
VLYYLTVDSIIQPAIVLKDFIHHFYGFDNKAILCDNFFDCYLLLWESVVYWSVIVDIEGFYLFTKSQNLIIER